MAQSESNAWRMQKNANGSLAVGSILATRLRTVTSAPILIRASNRAATTTIVSSTANLLSGQASERSTTARKDGGRDEDQSRVAYLWAVTGARDRVRKKAEGREKPTDSCELWCPLDTHGTPPRGWRS